MTIERRRRGDLVLRLIVKRFLPLPAQHYQRRTPGPDGGRGRLGGRRSAKLSWNRPVALPAPSTATVYMIPAAAWKMILLCTPQESLLLATSVSAPGAPV
jgi:hypothetical protein